MQAIDTDQLTAKVLHIVAAVAGCPVSELGLDTKLLILPIDSLEFVLLIQDFEDEGLGRISDAHFGRLNTIGDIITELKSL